MVADMAAGRQAKDSAKACGVSSSCIHDLKGKLARDLRTFMGENAIADCLHHPLWKGDVTAEKEKAACRADRRRG